MSRRKLIYFMITDWCADRIPTKNTEGHFSMPMTINLSIYLPGKFLHWMPQLYFTKNTDFLHEDVSDTDNGWSQPPEELKSLKDNFNGIQLMLTNSLSSKSSPRNEGFWAHSRSGIEKHKTLRDFISSSQSCKAQTAPACLADGQLVLALISFHYRKELWCKMKLVLCTHELFFPFF